MQYRTISNICCPSGLRPLGSGRLAPAFWNGGWYRSAALRKDRIAGGCNRLLGENAPGFVEEDAFEVHLEGLRVAGFAERFLLGDNVRFDQIVERLVEG